MVTCVYIGCGEEAVSAGLLCLRHRAEAAVGLHGSWRRLMRGLQDAALTHHIQHCRPVGFEGCTETLCLNARILMEREEKYAATL